MSDDNRITKNVKKELNDAPIYKFTDVDVKTFNGVVQLSGFVNTQDQKQNATEIAQRVSGVSQVINNIMLKPEGTTPTGRASGQPNTGTQSAAPAQPAK